MSAEVTFWDLTSSGTAVGGSSGDVAGGLPEDRDELSELVSEIGVVS